MKFIIEQFRENISKTKEKEIFTYIDYNTRIDTIWPFQMIKTIQAIQQANKLKRSIPVIWF